MCSNMDSPNSYKQHNPSGTIHIWAHLQGGFSTVPPGPKWKTSFVYQGNFLRSCHKFLHKSWSNFIFRISTKYQLQILNHTWLNLKIKTLTKHSFRISTKIKLNDLKKHQQKNTDQTSASKSRMNFNYKILAQYIRRVSWLIGFTIIFSIYTGIQAIF